MARLRFSLCWIFTFANIFLFAQNRSYLALGDSYTIGESVEEKLRWPNQLIDSLNKGGLKFNYPTIIAKTGWRSDELIEAIENRNIEDKFDLVSLLIGVNNQYQNKSIEKFEKEFIQLIERAISLSKNGKKGVFVVSIPNYGVTPYGQKMNFIRIKKELDQYNLSQKQYCINYNIPFFNITDISENAKNDLSLVANDGLHPSGKMYNLWIQEIMVGVNNMIKEQ